MNIDRSRFLLLAAALSANACTINNTTTNAQSDSGSSNDSTTNPVDSGTDSVTTDDALDASDAATDGATEAEATCSDDGPAVEGCPASTADGGTCDLTLVPQCNSYSLYFKPRVAKKAVDCIAGLPSCEGTEVNDCGTSALEGSCPDDTVNAYCDGLVAVCSPDGGADAGGSLIDLKAQCKLYAGGLNDAGRTALQAAVTAEGGCTTPLRDLITNL